MFLGVELVMLSKIQYNWRFLNVLIYEATAKVEYVTMSLRLSVAIPTINHIRACDVFDMGFLLWRPIDFEGFITNIRNQPYSRYYHNYRNYACEPYTSLTVVYNQTFC